MVMMSTKMTKGGQTTVPKEIRDALGIDSSSRVYWVFDGSRAYLSAEPPMPLEVQSEEDFRNRLEEAGESASAGRVRDAAELSSELRDTYGLA